MINGLSGRPGSGKTYEAVVRHILPALKEGRMVVTNIPLKVDWFVMVCGPHVLQLIKLVDGGFHNYGEKRYFSQAQDFLQYDTWRNENNQGVYFFVDESHLSMPQGGTDKALKEYLSMHRHYGHDIMLLTQNFRKVDRDVKDMVQNCYFCTKLSFLGRDEKYVVKVADGVSRNYITTHQREYDSKYYAAYQSHTKANGSVTEATTADVTKWYQRWTTKGAVICFGLAILILLANFSREKPDLQANAQEKLYSSRNPDANAEQQPIESQPQAPAQAVTSSPRQQAQPKKEDKTSGSHPFNNVDLHLSGYYEDYDRLGRFKKIVYFAVSRNGQYLSEVTNSDLALAGYNVQLLANCVARVSYGDSYERFVLCDTPSVGVTSASESLASTN